MRDTVPEHRKEKGMLRYIMMTASVIAGDGILKKRAEKELADNKSKRILGGRIRIHLLHNPGAALGVWKDHPSYLLALNSVMLGAVCGFFAHLFTKKGNVVAKTGLALAIGGGVSNLWDRIRRGYVTDYFSIHLGERFARLESVVFNVSDVCIILGLLGSLFMKKEDASQGEAPHDC